jgi:hypothetical protein
MFLRNYEIKPIKNKITCNLCSAKIEKYKTNSHVIPRWMIIEFTKVKGKNVLLNKSENSLYKIKERNQRDLIFDYVCDECEEKFNEDDTFSPQFFREKIGYIGLKNICENNQIYELEEFNSSINLQLNLKKFIISVIIRYELFLLSIGKRPNLGCYFDTLKEEYLKKNICLTKYPMTILKFNGFSEGALSTPYKNRIKGINAICLSFKGYYFTIYFDKRPIPESQNLFLVKQDKFEIFTFTEEKYSPIKNFALDVLKNKQY